MDVLEQKNYTTEDLLDIIRCLRQPDGCPWDQRQTHDSIKRDLIEETYEVIEAIEQKNMTALCEELGDVLLQVVFHSQIATEQGDFSFDQVVNSISRKLIRRHPHVFGQETAIDEREVSQIWEKEKEKERVSRQKVPQSTLKEVPQMLPALLRNDKVLSRAKRQGMPLPTLQEHRQMLVDQLADLPLEGAAADLQAAYGELLFEVSVLSFLAGVDGEQALRHATNTFVQGQLSSDKSE